MIAKLLADLLFHGRDPAPMGRALVAGGLCDAPALAAALRAAETLNRRGLLGRIKRCLQESTEFTVERRPWATVHRRREIAPAGEWVEGGPELVRYWIGDRSLEVLQARPPSLAALQRPAAWSPGRTHRLRVVAGGAGSLAAAGPELLAGHARYQELREAAGGRR
jgi:hypothetical protein